MIKSERFFACFAAWRAGAEPRPFFFSSRPKKDKKAPASGSTGGGGFAELWLMKKVFGRTAYQAGCALLAFFLPVMKQ